ncbi:MAG TPA: hypothetical protein VIN08_04865 [Ohtaekwangia sp.]|uniref:hypothetical protein n=1 Tax=Ohtaekwangia sp. TaxID=2066019 RepID=UPI002F928560
MAIIVSSCSSIIEHGIVDAILHKSGTIIFLIIGGLFFTIFRSGIFVIEKTSNNNIIDTIRKHPMKAEDYATRLDIPYTSKLNFDRNAFQILKARIQISSNVENYRILHVHTLDEQRILIFTELSFIDYDITITGKPEDIDKKSYHNFLVQYTSSEEFKIYSNLYSNSIEKFQKEEFYKSLLTIQLS